MIYRRFGIYSVNFDDAHENSCVQGGVRPAIVISNEMNNVHSPTVQVIPVTSAFKKNLPVHVDLCGFGLRKPSIALCEQIQTIPKCLIGKYIGEIDNLYVQNRINKGIKIQLNLSEAV